MAASIAAAAAFATSGCGIDKAAEHGRQLDVIGDVEISTTFCTSGDTDELSHACAPFSFAHRGQVLVAYRLPDGASIPAQLIDDGGLRHFTWSETYTAYMRDTYPAEGMYWAAYVSDPYSNAAGQQFAFTLSPEITLPNAGTPFAGPLRYQVVGGYRAFGDPSDDGSAAVDCDDDSTICASAGVTPDDSVQPTRDLAVLPGGEPPVVEAGGHVAVPFDLRFAGSGGEGVAFSLAASEGKVSRETLQPASDSDSTVTVDVAVPADAEPGDYEVSLTATALGEDDIVIRKVRGARLHAGGSQTRTGTMKYRVVAPSPEPPAEPPAAPAVDPPSAPPGPAPVQHTETPPPVPVPQPVHAPRAGRARLALSLTALPRRAYSGMNVAYLVKVRNVSRAAALRTRTCAQLPHVVQLLRASAGVRFDGSRLCFTRRLLAARAGAAARLVVHVDVDARPGMTHAHASAAAANADRVRARARMRVLRRPCRPEHAPVTG